MPSVLTEEQRQKAVEYSRRYRAANRERILEQRAEYRAANRNRLAADARERAAADREKSREKCRRWRERNPEKARESQQSYRARNRDKVLKTGRESKLRSRHGAGIFDWLAETWIRQEGRCYLCGDLLQYRQGKGPTRYSGAVIDHDHSCCPQGYSCAACRRGLACAPCNILIGYANDDLDRLLRIAANGRPVFTAARERIAAKPAQLTLG